MPRIDPLQLLNTLHVLLSPRGGIKSSDEVVRLVQLMQKFSKKLVSKSIYIEILRATTPVLLEKFLNEKGWDLLNLWFSDSIKTQNWPLCLDIMTLFSECPITAALLKDTLDVNQAPKLINQLRINPNIDEKVRESANVVYTKWVAIVSPKPSEPVVAAKVPAVKPSPLRNIRRNARGAGGNNTSGRGRGGRAQRILSNDYIEDSEDSTMGSEDSDEVGKPAQEHQPPVTFKIKIGTPANVPKAEPEVKNGTEEDGPITLLKSLAEEVSESLNKEKAQKDKEKEVVTGKRRKSDEEKKQKEKALREKEKEREKEKKRKQQQLQSNHLDERERKRFRPDRRDEVDPEEKQRIKEKARLLKEEAQAKKDKDTLKKIGSTAHTSTFSRIPKIPKKPIPASPDDGKSKDSKGLSFEALLGGLDQKPKTVKTPMVKNKTAALLESFSTKTKSPTESNTSSSKHHSHHHTSSHHHHHHSSSSSPSSSKRDNSKKEKESSKKESSPSSSSRRHHDDKHRSSSSRPAKLTIPSKRNSIDLESPKGSGKNTSLSESTGFMNSILHSMRGDEPKKKKRRLSEMDNEAGESPSHKKSTTPEKKPDVKTDEGESVKIENMEDEEEQKPVFSFYRDTLEEPKDEDEEERDDKIVKAENDDDKNDSNSEGSVSPTSDAKDTNGSKKVSSDDMDDNLPFEEPEAMPREVKGILVYHRGKERRNKSIKFKKDSEIVSIRYFELDEDERVNVNKIKFENMRQIELKMEKAAFKSKDSMGPEENDLDKWTRPIRIDVDNREPFVPGHASKEKDIQFNREKTVLAAFLYSKETTPDTPSEPDNVSMMMLAATAEKPIIIPLEDQSNDDGDNNERDFSKDGWPEPQTNQVDRQANFETDFSLNPALSNLLSSIESSGIQAFLPQQQQQGLSQDELNIYKAQTEAIAKMGIIPGVDIPPTFPPPRGPPQGPPHNMPPQMQHQHHNMMGGPMENTGYNNYHEEPEFYGGGPPQGFNGPPQHGPPFDHRGQGRRFNNFNPHNNYPPQGPHGGRGFPPHPNRGFRGGGGPPMRGNNDFYRERDNRRPRGGGMGFVPTKPCKFFAQNGTCRDGDNCRFLH